VSKQLKNGKQFHNLKKVFTFRISSFSPIEIRQ